MKFGSLFFVFVLTFCITHSLNGQELVESKISLTGKVTAYSTNDPVLAQLIIEVAGHEEIEIQTDQQGNFLSVFSASPFIKITANAFGFELKEQVISLNHLKADTSLYVNISLTPSQKAKLTGHIFDQKTNNPVEAEIDLYLDNDILAQDIRNAKEGNYEISFPELGWYLIEISSPGYINTTDTLWIVNTEKSERKKNYYLIPLDSGLTVRLKNVQFNFGKSTLLDESYEELASILALLKNNPTLKLEIAGHTDSDGPDDYNLILSQNRAQAVVDYLINQGIENSRIVAKGYGESRPIDNRETRYAKSVNRRVEFTVLKID